MFGTMKTVVVTLAAIVATGRANYQFSDDSWTRVAYCDTNAYSALDYPVATLAQMASVSTSVKICSYGSTLDCVTSASGSFPIQQFAAGRLMISRQLNGSCCARGAACLGTVWSGPPSRVNEMMFTCSGGCAARVETPTVPDYIYHACGNANGMHFTVRNSTTRGRTTQCSWGRSSGGYNTGRGRLEAFINFPVTTAPTTPTAAPTAAPTGSNDPTITAQRVDVLERNYRAVMSQIAALSSSTTAQTASVLSSLTSVAVRADDNSVVAADLVMNMTMVQGNVSGLVGALRTAVATAAVGGGGTTTTPPQVTATAANELVLNSAAAVKVTTGTCSNNDLCGAASFAATLKAALQNL